MDVTGGFTGGGDVLLVCDVEGGATGLVSDAAPFFPGAVVAGAGFASATLPGGFAAGIVGLFCTAGFDTIGFGGVSSTLGGGIAATAGGCFSGEPAVIGFINCCIVYLLITYD